MKALEVEELCEAGEIERLAKVIHEAGWRTSWEEADSLAKMIAVSQAEAAFKFLRGSRL